MVNRPLMAMRDFVVADNEGKEVDGADKEEKEGEAEASGADEDDDKDDDNEGESDGRPWVSWAGDQRVYADLRPLCSWQSARP